jgi:hypothetical protein
VFPPYGDEDADSWGVQHVMHPDLGQPAGIFAKWYTSNSLIDIVKSLLGCQENELQMGAYEYFFIAVPAVDFVSML